MRLHIFPGYNYSAREGDLSAIFESADFTTEDPLSGQGAAGRETARPPLPAEGRFY